jgi:hypothetical protein
MSLCPFVSLSLFKAMDNFLTNRAPQKQTLDQTRGAKKGPMQEQQDGGVWNEK